MPVGCPAAAPTIKSNRCNIRQLPQFVNTCFAKSCRGGLPLTSGGIYFVYALVIIDVSRLFTLTTSIQHVRTPS